MNAIEELRGLIGQAAQGAGFVIGEDEFAIQQAPQHTGADFASNIGLVLAKKEAKNPRAIAQSIIDKLLKNAAAKDVIDTSQVAGAGFVNMRLADAYLMKVLDFSVRKGRDIGQGNALKGRKIMVEFTDPNPFKEFHIGHLYSNTVGECIARLLEGQGAAVKRASYQGDVGLHVARAMWGMKQKFRDTDVKSVEQYSLEDKAKFLGQAYALGSRCTNS
jgi:arginyl-tRNA synthetase